MKSKKPDQWWDVSWNPWIGCDKVSAGCQNCYAQKIVKRFFKEANKPLLSVEPFYKKFKPGQRVFVCSLSDFFHPDISQDNREAAYQVMQANLQTRFIIPTKRPVNITIPRSMNVWLGVSVENKSTLHRIDTLHKTGWPNLFLSVEPLLEDLPQIPLTEFGKPFIKWVICGAETGPGARIMDPWWGYGVMKICHENKIPFWFKKQSKGQPCENWMETREYPEGLK